MSPRSSSTMLYPDVGKSREESGRIQRVSFVPFFLSFLRQCTAAGQPRSERCQCMSCRGPGICASLDGHFDARYSVEMLSAASAKCYSPPRFEHMRDRPAASSANPPKSCIGCRCANMHLSRGTQTWRLGRDVRSSFARLLLSTERVCGSCCGGMSLRSMSHVQSRRKGLRRSAVLNHSWKPMYRPIASLSMA